MRPTCFAVVFVLLIAGLSSAAEQKTETFHAYVDSDICARLMPGLVSDARLNCTQQTSKEGSSPVLVRVDDSMVLSVNKEKLLKDHVSQFVEATGEVKVKDGRVKLESLTAVEKADLPGGGAGSDLLDVRLYRVTGDSGRLHEQIRHELAMMPYISEFDFLSFVMHGNNVILTGWTVRETNRSTAHNLVKRIEGVGTITNNIEVLPLGRMDNQIRAGARASLQRMLGRYFWGSGSGIKIIVKNGDIILLGNVLNQSDADTAKVQCSAVPGAFHVFNLLHVEKPTQKKEKAD